MQSMRVVNGSLPAYQKLLISITLRLSDLCSSDLQWGRVMGSGSGIVELIF